MDVWWQISLLLCCYGFFKEYRPSEPFISPFLTGPWKNFTDKQVMEEIYPIGIYCNLFLLILVFLFTDYLRYKPVLIIGGFAGIITWTTLIFGKTIPVMQATEFFYGIFMASEVAYYTYIYAKVDKEHYQKVTSHTRAAFLLGKASAGLSSQLLVHFKILDYLELNYATVSAMIAATLVSIFLPSVRQSVYFHRCQESVDNGRALDGGLADNNENQETERKLMTNKFRNAFNLLYSHLKEAYLNHYVVELSVWWALATSIYLQVMSYCQLLWEEINRVEKKDLFNGLVEFIYSLLGAGAAFGVGYLKLPRHVWGVVLGIFTLFQGGCIFYASYLSNLSIAYGIHIAFGIMYQVSITIASSEVAKEIREDSYALIFGINTFISLGFETVLTVIVIRYLKAPIRLQFQIYGTYLFTVGIIYLLIAIYVLCMRRKRRERLTIT